ncbi:MAG TPA: DUF1015 family protein [Hyphomicrobiaceae bacterium]|nr:DUF1015 family protein [Hyphomicrobiaceae bacterium]
MTLIRPFRALRPVPTRAREIIAPPYDVLSSAEARERAKGKPWSFLHVSKAEIDLPAGTDPYSDAVYATAAENLQRMRHEDVLMRDANPYYYAYRATWTGGRQTGLACVASLDAYASGRIKKHELTTPVKETDRVRQIEALNAQTGPVMLAYPHAPEIDRALKRATERDPDVAVTADDTVTHELWVIGDAAIIEEFTQLFDALPALYIADGHHRSAAALRVAEARSDNQGWSHRHFLSVVFPHHEMTILDYNRVIRDLNGRTPEQLLAQIGQRFAVAPSQSPVRPAGATELGMFLGGRWYQLRLLPELAVDTDPIGRLPITLLTRNLIEPILGIADPRTDKRIDFVGGGRGLGELERRVNSGEMAVAFALFPTSMEDLMAVSDTGGIMPPKSTWFEPKLADGMVSHVLD